MWKGFLHTFIAILVITVLIFASFVYSLSLFDVNLYESLASTLIIFFVMLVVVLLVMGLVFNRYVHKVMTKQAEEEANAGEIEDEDVK